MKINEIGKQIRGWIGNIIAQLFHEEELQAENARLKQINESLLKSTRMERILELEKNYAGATIRASRAEAELAILKAKQNQPTGEAILAEIIDKVRARIAHLKDPKGFPEILGQEFYLDLLAVLNDYANLLQKQKSGQVGA